MYNQQLKSQEKRDTTCCFVSSQVGWRHVRWELFPLSWFASLWPVIWFSHPSYHFGPDFCLTVAPLSRPVPYRNSIELKLIYLVDVGADFSFRFWIESNRLFWIVLGIWIIPSDQRCWVAAGLWSEKWWSRRAVTFSWPLHLEVFLSPRHTDSLMRARRERIVEEIHLNRRGGFKLIISAPKRKGKKKKIRKWVFLFHRPPSSPNSEKTSIECV